MHRHWLLFREFVSTCENPEVEMEIEVLLLIDNDYETDNLIRLQDLTTGDELFNSYDDFYSIISNRRNPDDEHNKVITIFFDLCVPKNHTYMISITDRQSDGFTNGLARVYRDRALFARVEGDFGDSVVIEIQEGSFPWLPLIISPDKKGSASPVDSRQNPSTPSPTAIRGVAPTVKATPIRGGAPSSPVDYPAEDSDKQKAKSPANRTSHAGWSVPIIAMVLSLL